MKILLLNPPSKEKILKDYYCCSSTKTDYLPSSNRFNNFKWDLKRI